MVPEPYGSLEGDLALTRGYMLEIDDGLDGLFMVAYDGKTNPSNFAHTVSGLRD